MSIGLAFAATVLAADPGAMATSTVPATSTASPTKAAEAPPLRYIFSWPVGSDNARPRGGTTQGAPVTIDREPSAAWKALQEPGLSVQERDRRAIMAMAGEYRVSFDFIEVDAFGADRAKAPYQSWGTEKVMVDQDRPAFISLVHILEMRVVGKDGAISEPMVTKHWRQDWAWQPRTIVEYKGNDQWRSRPLSKAESQGAWVQTVYQVDESPRYASVGRWQHSPSFSTWISADTWRPLPRREWSVRNDYQVLEGTNRHTVGPLGWTQEENNLKTVITAQRTIDPARPYVAREYGIARYERLRDADFALADRYFDRTRVFWDGVRQAWSDAFANRRTITLKGPVDKLGLFMPLFERADEIEQAGQGGDTREDASVIRASLADMGVYQN